MLPEDFAARLHRLKEVSVLTWNGFALAIGVDRKQLRRWRKKGVEPSGGPMLSLSRFAARMPGGLEILMGEGFQFILWDDDEEEGELDPTHGAAGTRPVRPRWRPMKQTNQRPAAQGKSAATAQHER